MKFLATAAAVHSSCSFSTTPRLFHLTSATIAQWLKDKGYSADEVKHILAKLADHDHQTLSDAVFDSIGNSGKTLDQIIGEALRD